MIFPVCCPLPRVCLAVPMFSSARFTCSAMLEIILSKIDSAEFQQRWRAVKSTWDEQVGSSQFEELCQRFEKSYPCLYGRAPQETRPLSRLSHVSRCPSSFLVHDQRGRGG